MPRLPWKPFAICSRPASERNRGVTVEIHLRGIGVSPGIAIGPAFSAAGTDVDVPKYEVTDPEAEIQRFEVARDEVRETLQRHQEEMEQRLGTAHGEIFRAELAFVNDDIQWNEVIDRVRSEKQNIEYLIDELIKTFVKQFEAMENEDFRGRTDIYTDVRLQLLKALLRTNEKGLDHLTTPSVIVAHDLTPSDTAKMDQSCVLGIATDVSGPTSHTAILARALEIPAVVGIKQVGAHVAPGDEIIVDGSTGRVVIRPNAQTLAAYQSERTRQETYRKTLESADAGRVAATRDGIDIPILANVELPSEVAHGLRQRAQGIGLYRTEYIYLSRDQWPTEEDQYHAYAQVAAAMHPAPVTLRTLDVGGDKLLSHLPGFKEPNPQLGWRAVRFCIDRPDIFKAQLRAMLRASVHGDIQIMFPMISSVEELRQVKTMYNEVQADLALRNVSFREGVKVGAMIEVPAAVMIADSLAKECDFFSIGSNDLIQFSIGIDRVNDRTAHMYEPAHPAVLKMIHTTVAASDAAQIPCTICGEMAGDPFFTEMLLGLGVDALSMSPVAIPAVRAQIREINLQDARGFAHELLQHSTAHEIRHAIGQRYERRAPAQPAMKTPASLS